MYRQPIIERTVKAITLLPEDKAAEISDFADFVFKHTKNTKNYDQSRWFNSDNELLNFDGKTFAFSNQNGKETFDLATKMLDN